MKCYGKKHDTVKAHNGGYYRFYCCTVFCVVNSDSVIKGLQCKWKYMWSFV